MWKQTETDDPRVVPGLLGANWVEPAKASKLALVLKMKRRLAQKLSESQHELQEIAHFFSHSLMEEIWQLAPASCGA